jgi:hypothetical protein
MADDSSVAPVGGMQGALASGLLVQLVLGACSGGAMAYAAYVLISPTVGPPPLFPYQDKVFHAVCFAALTGPAALVLPRRYLWFWVAHMVLLGIGIEVVQAKWIPERTGSILDFLADAVGIALAVWIGRWVRSFVMRRASKPV